MFIHSSMYQDGISYLVDHLKANKYLINHHYYGDHLLFRDRLSLIKRIFDRSSVILFSGEAQEHSWKYLRPKWIADAYFTHLDAKNSIYYTLFFEECLAHDVFWSSTSNLNNKSKKAGIVLAASNNSKILRFKNKYPEVFSEVDLYGAFSKKIPENNQYSAFEDPLNTRNYFYDAGSLSKKYKAAICLDNSFEYGYFQGTPMLHLSMGTVPIYDGPKYWKNFINEEFIIELSKYSKLTPKEKKSTIQQIAYNIENAQGDFLTGLTLEYLDFLKSSLCADQIDFNNLIKESIYFRERFLKV